MSRLGEANSNTELLLLLKAIGIHYSHGNTYISGTGTAGADNTAQAVKTITMPANVLAQVGDRLRVRVYWMGDSGVPITATATLNGVTITHTTDSGASGLQINESYIHYIDATHANIIEDEMGALGPLSAVNVAGFNWAVDQSLTVSQDQVINNHIIVFCIMVDILPKGI